MTMYQWTDEDMDTLRAEIARLRAECDNKQAEVNRVHGIYLRYYHIICEQEIDIVKMRAELATVKLTRQEYGAVDELMRNIGKYGYMISWLMPEPDDNEHYMNLVDAWWERQEAANE